MSFLIYNGVPSTEVNARIEQPPDYKSPERSYFSVTMDGRNGSILIDNGFFNNCEVTYHMSMDATQDDISFNDIASAVMAWLHPIDSDNNGYYKLIDAYDPTHFRWAKVKGDVSIANIFNKAGTFDITFECMPQRFLVSGAEPVVINENFFTLNNPTSQIAMPVFNISNFSTTSYVCVRNETGERYEDPYYREIKVSYNLESPIVISSLEENCIDVNTNNNLSSALVLIDHIKVGEPSWFETYPTYSFPVLYPGPNTILYNNISNLTITPNWWDL